MKVGVVIGSFNIPQFVELQLAAIQYHCGSIPVLIADNCSDGYDQIYRHPETKYWQLHRIIQKYPNAKIWQSYEYVSWGGDIAAYWKGIVWAKHTGLDILFKLSQRCLVDYENWAQIWGEKLFESDCETLGRDCDWHKWKFRTESAGLKVNAWYDTDILETLMPRDLKGWPTEQMMYDDIIQKRFDGRLLKWDLMAKSRPERSPYILYREPNEAADYEKVARKLNIPIGDYDCRSREACKGMDRIVNGLWVPPNAK